MTNSQPQPPDGDDQSRERSTFGKFFHALMIVAVTLLVALFLVFGFCMLVLSKSKW